MAPTEAGDGLQDAGRVFGTFAALTALFALAVMIIIRPRRAANTRSQRPSPVRTSSLDTRAPTLLSQRLSTASDAPGSLTTRLSSSSSSSHESLASWPRPTAHPYASFSLALPPPSAAHPPRRASLSLPLPTPAGTRFWSSSGRLSSSVREPVLDTCLVNVYQSASAQAVECAALMLSEFGYDYQRLQAEEYRAARC